MSGISRAARAGVIVKGGAVIEQLGRARTVLLDKTGTLTLGVPEIEQVIAPDGVGPDELVRLAASLDQLSAHPFADAVVAEARSRGLGLAFPREVAEAPGSGISGRVEDRAVAVGSETWLRMRGLQDDGSTWADEVDPGRAVIAVAVDGRAAGAIVLTDRLREDAKDLVPELEAAGIGHVMMVTGDRAEVGRDIARRTGIERIYPELTPMEKLEVVRALQSRSGLSPVVMVGDGINDAPALALADVGIALGAAGATVSSDTADAVVVVDRVDRVAEAIRSAGARSRSRRRASLRALV
jgi:cation transport ATPase